MASEEAQTLYVPHEGVGSDGMEVLWLVRTRIT
jgi:hypothetical protein